MSDVAGAQVRAPVVIGAGIAGLHAAIALRQLGMAPQVFERAEEIRAVGGGIHLWHNAMQVCDRLGIGEDLIEVGTVMREAQFRTRGDLLLGRWPLHELDEVHDTVTIGIARSDLLDVLQAHVPAESIHTGAELTDLKEHADGVELSFADGRTVDADLVIGADGIRSTVRTLLKGDAPTRYAGYMIWQGTIPEFPDARAPVGEFRLYYGPGTRFAWYHIGGGRLYWFALADRPENEPLADDPRPELSRTFAGWPDPVPELPGITPLDDVQRFAMRDRVPDGDWSTGRITLVGDAAHAMTFNTGQGACQGIEDALVLQESLRREADLAAALRRYQAVRVPRTTDYVTRAWQLGTIARWRNPAAVAFRTAVMSVIMRTVAWKQHRDQMALQL